MLNAFFFESESENNSVAASGDKVWIGQSFAANISKVRAFSLTEGTV